MKLYFIHMPGCPACERAKPHLSKWQRENPQVQVVPVNLLTAKWVSPWQPEVTPTYVLEVPGKPRTQYQGMMTKTEIPKFIAQSMRTWGMQ